MGGKKNKTKQNKKKTWGHMVKDMQKTTKTLELPTVKWVELHCRIHVHLLLP